MAELMNPTEALMRQIGDKRMKRKDVAQAYRFALESSATTDWPKVNAAIINRWSLSALLWIKERAWSGRCFDG